MPAGELRIVSVGEVLGDDTLEVGVDHAVAVARDQLAASVGGSRESVEFGIEQPIGMVESARGTGLINLNILEPCNRRSTIA